MKSFNCNECIHMNVCPAYMVTMPECNDFLPIGNVIPVVRCGECKYGKLDAMIQKIYGKKDGSTLYHCLNGYGYNKSEHFCSYGERAKNVAVATDDAEPEEDYCADCEITYSWEKDNG